MESSLAVDVWAFGAIVDWPCLTGRVVIGQVSNELSCLGIIQLLTNEYWPDGLVV